MQGILGDVSFKDLTTAYVELTYSLQGLGRLACAVVRFFSSKSNAPNYCSNDMSEYSFSMKAGKLG
jgi:hypothetical protein